MGINSGDPEVKAVPDPLVSLGVIAKQHEHNMDT